MLDKNLIGNTFPKVGIVIINWNCASDVQSCVASLKEMDYPNVEIIVVDNASTDDSADVIADTVTGITLLRNKTNLGCGGGNNLGMQYASEHGAEYIWLLNADTKVYPKTLSLLMQEMRRDPKIGLISPILYNLNDPSFLQYCGSQMDFEAFKSREFKSLDELEKADKNTVWSWATAAVIRGSLIEKIGGLDESFFIYYEDHDFCIRVKDAGYKIHVLSDARVLHRNHFKGGSQQMPAHYYFYITRNYILFCRRFNCGLKRLRILREVYMKDFEQISDLIHHGRKDLAEAMLDGIYWAFKDKSGFWDKQIRMPCFWRNFFLEHCDLTVDLIELHWGRIFLSLSRKIRIRLFGKGNVERT
jgi:hypothetical protein